MERSVEGSFRDSGEARKKHLQDLASAGEGTKIGRRAGLSLEGMKETGDNVGSDDTHVTETRARGKGLETKNYDLGSSGSIQEKIEQVKAQQAAARAEAAKEGGPNEYVMLDEETAQVELSVAEKRRRLAELMAERDARKGAEESGDERKSA